MIKKIIIFLFFGLLMVTTAWAQGYLVLDTGDPSERGCNPKSYTDLGNGIVRDDSTGLEWDRWGSSSSFTWQDARDFCSSLMLGGHTDWRLPSVEELMTLMDAGIADPAIDPVFFSYADLYWTSTIFANDTDRSYFVDFGTGVTNNELKKNTLRVRAVRHATGGQADSFTVQSASELDVSISSAVQPCSNDLDCDSGEVCIIDICVPSVGVPCSNDLDCDSGEVCIVDICVPSVGQPCSNDLDCDSGEVCIVDICVPSVGQPCSNDLDCDSGEECIDDICVPLSGQLCLDDLDCVPGEECIDDICVPSAVDPDMFTVNGDGTVTDNNTDLVWAHCAYGQIWDGSQCKGDPGILTWDTAAEYVEDLNNTKYLGYDDWRLPTKNELESLMYRTRAMPTTRFPGMDSGFYWSATNNVHGEVWAACYWFGNFHAEVPKTNSELYTMRAVRGGSCLLDGDLCIDSNDCLDDNVCKDGMCVESTCSLIVKHSKIRADKLFKPRKRTLHITGGEGFDMDGLVDPGPFILRKDPMRKIKKNKLTLKIIVPEDLQAGRIKISVGNCIGEVEIQ